MNKAVALSLLALLVLGSAFMAYERQGLLPWFGVLLGLVGIGATTTLNGRQTLYYLAAAYGLVIVGWVGSIYYVFSTWESGEVVDIQLTETVSFRTWVVEVDGKEALIYDCPPQNQSYLNTSNPVSVARGNEQFLANIDAVLVDFSSQALIDVYAQYEEKYAAESFATDIYYLLIGPKRGSQLHVVYLTRHIRVLKSPLSS